MAQAPAVVPSPPRRWCEADLLAGRVTEGMSFTERCWALCKQVPPGRVCTYGDLARAAGSPRAAIAAGQAMATNPYAPEIPCHRVVGADGALHGYAYGLPRKQALLEQEGVAIRQGRVDLQGPLRFTFSKS
ncbi:MAG: MGMT family protein [Planctomycetota bacterium]